MHEELFELAIHSALLALYSLITVVLAATSAFVEYRSYLEITSGDMLLAGWMAAIGLIVLAFAYFVLRDKALAEYRYLTG